MLSGPDAQENISARLGPSGELAHNQLMKLARVILRVQSPENLACFYVEHLGMTVFDEGCAVLLGFGGEGALIEMRPAMPGNRYTHRRSDRYWKIGITLPNVDMACAQLRKAGVEVSQPRQFGEIGYMCHLEDPEGFSIELLQHRFGRIAPRVTAIQRSHWGVGREWDRSRFGLPISTRRSGFIGIVSA